MEAFDFSEEDMDLGLVSPELTLLEDELDDDVLEADEVSLDSKQIMLDNIGKTELLTAAEEVELSKRIHAGAAAQKQLTLVEKYLNGQDLSAEEAEQISSFTQDDVKDLYPRAQDGLAAKELMVRANLRLVVSNAKDFQAQGLELPELVDEGTVGLIRAAEKFDWTKGFKFSTYATYWIRQAVGRAVAEKSRTIRVPVHVVENRGQIVRLEQKAATQNKILSDEDIVQQTSLSINQVRAARYYSKVTTSLNVSASEHEDLEVGDRVSNAEANPNDEVIDDPGEITVLAIHNAELSQALQTAIKILPQSELDVIVRRFGLDGAEPKTLEEIGKMRGISRERARQLENSALKKLASNRTLKSLN